MEEFNKRADSLHESNPMMGHRGVRLGISYPEMTEVQTQAILEAAAELIQAGKNAQPEIMIPVTSTMAEIVDQKKIIERVYEKVLAKFDLPKSKLAAGRRDHDRDPARLRHGGQVRRASASSSPSGPTTSPRWASASPATTSAASCPTTWKRRSSPPTPSRPSTRRASASSSRWASPRAASVKPTLKIGICGEHGGEPESVKFCHRVGMSYVSCSPYRVPLAKLAAAQEAAADMAAEKPAAKKAAPAAKKRCEEAGGEKGGCEKGSRQKGREEGRAALRLLQRSPLRRSLQRGRLQRGDPRPGKRAPREGSPAERHEGPARFAGRGFLSTR